MSKCIYKNVNKELTVIFDKCMIDLTLIFLFDFESSITMSISSRVAKFDPKVGSRRTTKIKNLVVLVIILVVLILLPYYMYVVLVLILLFLLV